MFRNLEISTEKICDFNSNVNQTPVEPSEHDHQLSYDRVVWFKVLQRRRQKEQQSSQHVLMIIFNMRHFQTSCKMSTETFMQTVTDFCSTKLFFLQLGILIRASPAMTEQCCAHQDHPGVVQCNCEHGAPSSAAFFGHSVGVRCQCADFSMLPGLYQCDLAFDPQLRGQIVPLGRRSHRLHGLSPAHS